MNFAKKQLEKYGWKEGEGLGKNRSGISKALKLKLKFDTGGLGHDAFEDINNTWWQKLYDDAAKNIITKKGKNDSVMLTTVEPLKNSTKKETKKNKKSGERVYTNFVKTAELSHNVEKKLIKNDEEPEAKKGKKTTRSICDYTDEELFRICGGRTAHKGARHGLKMSAKLARIEKQESSINACTPESDSTKSTVNSKKKKNK